MCIVLLVFSHRTRRAPTVVLIIGPRSRTTAASAVGEELVPVDVEGVCNLSGLRMGMGIVIPTVGQFFAVVPMCFLCPGSFGGISGRFVCSIGFPRFRQHRLQLWGKSNRVPIFTQFALVGLVPSDNIWVVWISKGRIR